ncbi:carbonic anhydrase [Campylobacter fetus]|uniref:Carbonic anhydrase n=2 Tax=Campylobacter fetus TaxID=196 RepID=A0RRM1_CAMFF|nr:carbonic anhydrase [Campylobacter fetus]ABK82443.1 carbonic anhydrase [Campylobacter fetus subsp. fetus 82-40]EAI3886527.1 carbonic anhydrase [Campylobacter fetus]EAI3915844.1 carbonic anhydrase [Campylobacter fetus]EAI3919242.1 carbonic anhydrase [Campylobacter fetus]EAI8858725.1 carbonic anhydrase [Campylobacter fetus]
MHDVINGAVKFMEEDFLEHKELFEKLGTKQTPHTLFIGCSDSRVVPNLITNTLPGELFVVRNIGNIVPYYRVSEEFLATTAAIEYAINVLHIKNIIVCGHSNCGGCAALYDSDEQLSKVPIVKRWLMLISDIKEEVLKYKTLSPAKRAWITERLNIINSTQNLLTFPGAKEKIENAEIKIYGWHYIIETGEVYNYDEPTKTFKLLEKSIDYDKIFNQIFTDF